ncbi:hypothetical protein AAAC51_09685 [Priestia megaterium]
MMFVIVALANSLWLVVWLTMIPFLILYIVYKRRLAYDLPEEKFNI